ncbi:MAG TPA: PAS domain-containing sensor histidine kinase [Patescibacteria group bacterium]|nr:PAS domain-containing sensor histidine kinase [Patescibacteria group bacterium]
MVNPVSSRKEKFSLPSSQKAEERFFLAQELSLDGFAILRPKRQNGKIIDFVWDYANPAAHRLLRQKNLLGKDFAATLPITEKSGLLRDFVKVMESNQSSEGEIAYRTAKVSGWFQLTVIKLEDQLALSFRDITERKLWEESLRQSEARFKIITESNMIGLFFWDETGAILDANDAFLKILGYDRKAFFEKEPTWRDLTPSEFWAADEKAMAEMKKSGVCQPFEKELRHKKDFTIPVLLGAARLTAINYEGVAFVVDISERKEMEKQREIFLGHELKTPLAAIKGFAQLVFKRLEKTADQETLSYLSRINGKVDSLAQLISDLTDLTRIRADQLEFREEVFDFDALTREVIADCQAIAPNHQLILEGKTNQFIFADKSRIGQVLTNLLSNAVKYSPRAKKVIIRLNRDKNHLLVFIQDFGFGISQEDQEKIFQPFFRSALSKNEVNGVGLGLYISRQIAQHYGGNLLVKSRPQEGTTFSFSLPIRKGHA